MKQVQKCFAGALVVFLLLALCSCGSPQNRMQKQFDRFLKTSFTSFLESDALSAHTFYTKPNSYHTRGNRAANDLGTRPSQETFAKIREDNQLQQTELKKIDRSLLNEQQQVNYDLFLFQLQREQVLYQEKFDFYHSFFNAVNGIHTQLPVLFIEFRVLEEADITLLISLLQDSGAFLDAYLSYAEAQSAKGTLLADCKEVAAYCRTMAEEGENSPVLKTCVEKLETLSLSESSKQEYAAQITQAVHQIFLPAYDKIASVMDGLAVQQSVPSLAALPDGKAYYEALFQDRVGTSASAADWKKRLISFCDAQKQRLGNLAAHSQQSYEALFNGAFQTGYDSYDGIMEALKKAIQADFPDIGVIPYTIGEIPASIASKGVAAYFCVPPLDSQLPRTIKVNKEASGDALGSISLYQLLAHEGMPGHLYQNAYAAQMLPDEPWRLSMLQFDGYTEGYAVYAQLHAVTYLPIEKDAAAVYQAAQLIQFTATAIMEIGIHYEGWSIDDAKAFLKTYGLENAAGGLYASLANTPGVFTPYYAGAAQFLLLREMAEKQLEGRFNLKQFHTVLLQYGKVPFEFLTDRLIDDLELNAVQTGAVLSLRIKNRAVSTHCPVYFISIPARCAC